MTSEVCVRYGFCDVRYESPDYIDPRRHKVSEIVDLILKAEGVARPEYYDKTMRRNIARLVEDWLFDSHGRGANSDLPLTSAQ